MKPLLLNVLFALLILPNVLHAGREFNKYDRAIGQALAANKASGWCRGIELISGKDFQQYVFYVSDVLKSQGLRKNRVRKLLFYGKMEYLNQVTDVVLNDRGIGPNQIDQLCSLARKIAGTKDPIGRFLKSP